jgi:hypothetical protein
MRPKPSLWFTTNKKKSLRPIAGRRLEVYFKKIVEMRLLFLKEVVDDLSAVLAVGAVRHVHPVGAFAVVLHDELVEVAVALDPVKPPFALQLVTVDAEVCRLALDVL